MAIMVKPKAPTPAANIKDGTYRARLTGIKQFANAYGDRIGFEFTVDGGPHDGQAIMRSTAPQLTPASKLAEVVEGLLGRSLTQTELLKGIDLEALIGSECQILVLQGRSRTGATFSNVEKVFQS